VERVPIQFAASAAVWRGNAVLLVQRAKDPMSEAWTFPGGHVEPGETELEAARRELLEETGVEADFTGLAGRYEVVRPGRHYVIHCFAARWCSGDGVAVSDARAVRWFESFGGILLGPNIREAITDSRRLLNL
jgi:ADP-ribose pyrophosphatase YjhB (NUDIX family)